MMYRTYESWQAKVDRAQARKIAAAAARRVQRIRDALTIIPADRLPDHLRLTAELILQYPDVRTLELCRKFPVKVAPETIRNRLDKIEAAATDYQREHGAACPAQH